MTDRKDERKEFEAALRAEGFAGFRSRRRAKVRRQYIILQLMGFGLSRYRVRRDLKRFCVPTEPYYGLALRRPIRQSALSGKGG